MAIPTIPNGEVHFFPNLYEGNGAGQRVGKFVPFTDSGTIANSCIFNSADSAYLTRTPSSSGSGTTFTVSFWFKIGKLGHSGDLFSNSPSGSAANIFYITHYSDNTILIHGFNSGGSFSLNLQTSRAFEDTSKWYHLLCAVDTTQSTSTDRVKLYIDGSQITSFSSTTYPGSNDNFGTNQSGVPQLFGRYNYDASRYNDGYIAEANMVDGQALLPASFGQTDTSTGRWVPSTVTPYPTTTTTYTITVVGGNPSNHPYHNVGSTNKFAIDGSTATADVTLNLVEGATYRFDQSDNSNSGHPLRFSTTANGTHGGGSEYTVGVTTNGTPGSSGAYTEITVANGAPTLYYYCTNHSAMGWTANTPAPYGTNGFRLKFQDSSALGDDTSGNGNDFTATNLASTDQTTDSPTQNHNTFGSFASGTSATEGNLTISTGTANGDTQCVGQAGFGVATGKWYWEAKITTVGAGLYGWKDDANAGGSLAVNNSSAGTHSTNNSAGMLSTAASGSFSAGSWFIDGNYNNEVNYTTVSTNDVLMFAIDLDTGKGYCGKNGTWFNSGNPANGTGDIGGCHFANGVNKFYPMARRLDANSVAEYNFGQRSFAYTPPSGFSALQQDNLPETSKGISGLVWTKNRDSTDNQIWMDSSRGAGQRLESAETGAQLLVNNSLNKFLVGGQQIGDYADMNRSGNSFVSWNWVANGGTTASNSNGSITSTVQANTTAGFSIVQYTGTGSNATVGHGLSSAPEWIIFKNLDNGSEGWSIYHTSLTSAAYILTLNNTNAQASSATDFNSTAPTSSVFSVGTNARTNNSSQRIVAYCWHSVSGFSRFGKYEGNNNANGTFVFTNFLPSFVMIKSIDGGSSSYPWAIYDNRRSPTNPVSLFLSGNSTAVENNSDRIDFLSNGFKLRQSYSYSNAGETYIYMAFAEHPFVGDGTSPVTAR